MKFLLLILALQFLANAKEKIRFDLDFKYGQAAAISVGQSSPTQGNLAVENGMLIVKSGTARGMSGAEIPCNPLCYQTTDNLLPFAKGEIAVEFAFRHFPIQREYRSFLWSVRRTENRKLTACATLQVSFSSDCLPLMEYYEYNSTSPAAKTIRLTMPLPSLAEGVFTHASLRLDGAKRILSFSGLPDKEGTTAWSSPEWIPRASTLVVGGAYPNSAKQFDSKAELLIRRLTIFEQVNLGENKNEKHQ